MVTTLRESKAKLSKLVEVASRGEDVLITVRGQAKARLTRVAVPGPAADRRHWVRELRALRKAQGARKPRLSVETILTEDREDRA